MNEKYVKSVIVEEVEKYFQIIFTEVYEDFLEKASVNSEIIHYVNNFGEVEAYVLTTIISETYTLVRKPFVKVIISNGTMLIEEYRISTSQFVYLGRYHKWVRTIQKLRG